jgi:hypothetical protein
MCSNFSGILVPVQSHSSHLDRSLLIVEIMSDSTGLSLHALVIQRPDDKAQRSFFAAPLKDVALEVSNIAQSATVAELKSNVAAQYAQAVKGKTLLVEDMVAVFGGRIQADSKTLKQAGIVNAAHVIFLRKKPQSTTEDSAQASRSPAPQPAGSQSTAAASIQQAMVAQLDAVVVDMQRSITPAMLQLLLEMGFSETVAIKALMLTGLNPDRAAEWIITNIDDPELEAPLSTVQRRLIAREFMISNPGMSSPAVPPPPPRVRTAIEEHVCTYAITGQNFAPQPYYHCYDCGFVDGRGVCQSCLDVCHAGHNVSARIDSPSFFCDCVHFSLFLANEYWSFAFLTITV